MIRVRLWWRRNVVDTLPGYYSQLDQKDGLR